MSGGFLGGAAVAGAAFFWGTSAAVAKTFFEGTPPVPVETLTAGRTTVAAALMAAWVTVARRTAWRTRRTHAASFLATGMVLALTNYTYYLAVKGAGVAAGILLQYLSPFFVFVYLAASEPGSVDRWSWAALGLVLAGAALVSGGAISGLPASGPGGVGAGILCALLFAVFTLRARGGIRRGGYWTFTLYAFLGAGLTGALILLGRQLLDPAPFPGPAPGRDLLLCGYLGAFGTVIPFSLFLAGVERIGPARAGIVSTLEPVFGGLAAFVLLGEAPTPVQLAGGAAIVTAVAALAWTARAYPAQVAEPQASTGASSQEG